MNKDALLRFDMMKAADYRAELLEEGEEKQLKKNIKTMASNGFDVDFIAKALSLDLSYVKEVLEQKWWTKVYTKGRGGYKRYE